MAKHWAVGVMIAGLLGFVASCNTFSLSPETPAHTMYAYPPAKVSRYSLADSFGNEPQIEAEVSIRTTVQSVEVGNSATIVTLAAGAGNGVKPDAAFVIYRGDEYLGKVRIVRVAPTASTAVVVEQRKQLRAGDGAVSSR